MDKRKIKRLLEPKIGGRRIILTRVIPTAALSIGILAGTIGTVAKKFSKEEPEKPQIIETVDNYKDLDTVMVPELDDFVQSIYTANEEIILYVEQDEEIKPVETINPEQQINVFNMAKESDSLNNEYVYCEIENEHIIGLVRTSDLSKATKIADKSVEFDSIYQISNPSVMGKYMQSTIGKDGTKIGENLKNGEVIFTDKTEIQMDNENNYWMKMRTNDGSIGYIQIDDTLQEVQDGILVEVTDTNNVSNINTDNLNTDVSNIITDVQVGSRLVVIGKGSTENLSKALYFDENGIAKWGEISNDLIKDVVLVTEAERLSPTFSENAVEEVNDVEGMKVNISNWLQDYKNGAYGIDIYGMRPDALKQLLVDSPNISYGILRLGATGYGHTNDGLKLADTSILVSDYSKELVKEQASIFEDAGIPVFAYFYATDTNPEEGYEVAELIEKSLDEVNLNVQPIVDCELAEVKDKNRNSIS